MDALNQIIEEKLPGLSALASCLRFAVQCRKNFPPGVPAGEEMRSADQEIVSNQTGDVGGQTRVAEFLPAEVREGPDGGRKCDSCRFGTEGYRRDGVPRNTPDACKMFDDFHKEAVARLAWPVPGNEFRIYGILGSLGIPADGECDGVWRIAAEVVADKIDCEWRDGTVAEFAHPEA